MKEFISIIWEWRFALIVAVAFILFCLLEWNKAKEILYALMLQAKSMAKDAILYSGQEQEEWVIKNAYRYISCLKWVPEPAMRKIIYWLYHTAKDKLDDGKINNSI